MELPLSVSLHELPEDSKVALQNELAMAMGDPVERVQSLQTQFKNIHGLEVSIDLVPLLPREAFVKHVLESDCIPGVATEQMAIVIFDAFNTSRTNKLRCSEYVLGILAFLTPVKENWPQFDLFIRVRKEMLFALYDHQQPFGLLDIGELKAVARKMRSCAGKPPLDDSALLRASARVMGISDEEELMSSRCTRETFIESVCDRLPLECDGLHMIPLTCGLASKKFEGTMPIEKLLSSETCILNFLEHDLCIPHKELEEQVQRYNEFVHRPDLMTLNEFKALHEGEFRSLEDLERLFRAFDLDKNGVISRAEYLLGLAISDPRRTRDTVNVDQFFRARLEMIFNMFDDDRNGTMEGTEFMQMLKYLSFAANGDVSPDALGKITVEVAAQFGASKKNFITRKEFVDGVNRGVLAQRGLFTSCILRIKSPPPSPAHSPCLPERVQRKRAKH